MTGGVSGRIVLGAMALRPGGSGVQTYERELIAALARLLPEAELAAVVQKDAVAELPASVAAIRRPVAAGVVRALLALRPEPDAVLFHGLDVDLPLGQGGPLVSTVHDLAVFDTPWAFARVRAVGERILLRRSLRRADAIIAVSAFTAERLHAVTGRTASVIPLAPAAWARIPAYGEIRRVRSRYALPPRFVLQAGTLEPRKRPDVVAAALDGLGVPLVLAGAGTDGPGRPPGSIGLGYVDSRDIPALYAAADVVAYASAYEGFGLPPVEAMACGAVVVASAVGGIREAVGDGGIVVRGLDPADWSPRLREALEDAGLRAETLAAARCRVRDRGWGDVAAETVDVYRGVV